MPELAEVETVVRGIRQQLVGRKILTFETDWDRALKSPSPEEFKAQIVGQTIKAVERRAKFIVIKLSKQTLVIHLRMSGHLFIEPVGDTEISKYVHGIFRFDNQTEMRLRDVRKFATMHLVKDTSELFADIGPEPLDAEFTDDVLKERLSQATKKKIKPLLLDQSFIAGIGNIYADEALWHARINPERIASTLKDDEVSRLRTGIREVLELGIARNGASVSTFQQPNGEKGQMQEALEAYGRTGLLCSRCKKSKIKKIVLAQRGTHFCPRCQK